MMKLRNLYLFLFAAGTVLPYTQFIAFILENGPDVPLFGQLLFANRIAGFFVLDAVISAIVLLVFVFSEGTRLGIHRLWLPVVFTFAVGVSSGLPLFLYLKQLHLEKTLAQAVAGR